MNVYDLDRLISPGVHPWSVSTVTRMMMREVPTVSRTFMIEDEDEAT
jgi:hypothetical protein